MSRLISNEDDCFHASACPRRSDSWAPRSRNEAIALAVLLHMPEPRERCVEGLHEHLVGDQHVEDFSPRCFCHLRNGAPLLTDQWSCGKRVDAALIRGLTSISIS